MFFQNYMIIFFDLIIKAFILQVNKINYVQLFQNTNFLKEIIYC